MQLRLWISIALAAMIMEATQLEAAQTIPSCRTVKPGPVNKLTLAEDLDCSAYTAKGTVGVLMMSNAMLDCNGFAIIGPVTTPPVDRDEYFGIYAEKKSKVKVENCVVKHYDRGLYFLNVKNSTVTNSHFQENTRYGANLAGKQSFNNVWDGNTFHDNDDEGIHISGEPTGFLRGTTKPNKFTNSSAYANDKEGWYLLGANYVEISGVSSVEATAGLAADNNGSPGFYIKHSHHNKIQNTKMYRDVFEITGESDYNTILNVTVVKGQVKIDRYEDKSVTPSVFYYPDHNTLDRVCIRHESGVPSTGFNFVGVTNGYNTITNSETILASISADPVKATETTTQNSVVDLYISPSGMTNDIEAGSFFMPDITMQTTTPPTCYGD